MRHVIALAALLTAIPALAQEPQPTQNWQPGKRTPCRPLSTPVAQPTQPAKVRPLTAEPPANLYLGVLRLEDGCDKPVVVRENIRDLERR